MAIPTLTNVQNLGEMKQNFRWNINLSELNSKLGLVTADKIPLLEIMCESVDLPKKDITWVTTTLRGSEVKQSGIANMSGETTMTFVDNVDNEVEKMIYQWGNIIFNTNEAAFRTSTVTPGTTSWGAGYAPLGTNSGTTSSKNPYKCDIIVQRVNANRTVIQEYKLLGCGYLNFDPGGQLSGGDSETTKPSLTVSYDAWVLLPKLK